MREEEGENVREEEEGGNVREEEEGKAREEEVREEVPQQKGVNIHNTNSIPTYVLSAQQCG